MPQAAGLLGSLYGAAEGIEDIQVWQYKEGIKEIRKLPHGIQRQDGAGKCRHKIAKLVQGHCT